MRTDELDLVVNTPKSNWYKFTLECGHEVYARVRLKYDKPGMQHHKVKCPKCTEKNTRPTAWQDLTDYEAVSDEHVSNVLSGTSFILLNWIVRIANDNSPGGNPLPYTSRDKDYR